MLQKIIRINGVEVENNSCIVDFRAHVVINGQQMGYEGIELTHANLYELLDTASEVEELNRENSRMFAKFKQGIVEYYVYTKK